MKKYLRWLIAAAMAMTLLGGGAALAAGEGAISVQLDGQEIVFTDAVPQVKAQRTFLPFRAVFEAMGAEVGNEGNVITAVRDGKTLTMTLDKTTATLTEGGKTTSITMDVSPYVDNATWRTYVPVRFAAQAFGCAVGWDQENSAVIIVDTGKMLDHAMEGKRFTYLEKLTDYSGKYDKGIWDMDAAFDADITVMGAAMPMSGTVKGAVADSEKLSMDMNMKMDMTEIVKLVSMLSLEKTEPSAEEQAMLNALKEKGIELSMRGDMAAGKLYMSMKGELFAASGISGEDWYRMDMAALAAKSGMDWTELMAMSKKLDCAALVKTLLTTASVDSVETGYTSLKAFVEKAALALSDEGFVKEGNILTSTVSAGEGEGSDRVSLKLTMKGDEVVGYVMEARTTAAVEDAALTMRMTVTMDDKDRMTAGMEMDMAGILSMNMTMEGGYTQGKTAPVTEPPAGAKVEDLMKLMGVTVDIEKIGE